MIRNADLYELINISLRANELENSQVEDFIQKALDKSTSSSNFHKPRGSQQKSGQRQSTSPKNAGESD
jgi:hypothetical protein